MSKNYKYSTMKHLLFYSIMLLSFLGFSQDKVVNITISQPNSVLSVSGTSTPASGFGLANGAIDITPAGGTAGYNYNWSNGATSQDVVGLTAGNYSVTVTDANGCTTSGSYAVTQPAVLSSSISVLNALNCFGGNNGSLRANGAGGAPGYTYLWNRNGSAYSNTRTISNLISANYSVTITDFNGNTSVSNYNLTQPSQIQYSVDAITDVNCFGDSTGSINISVSNGTPGYTYLWSKVGDASFSATTQDVNGLSFGQYNIQITDLNGCSITSASAITITQPSAPMTISTPTNGVQNPTAEQLMGQLT